MARAQRQYRVRRARRHRQVPSRRGARPRCLRAGHRVRFFSADDLVEALYRGLADNSVGKLIAGLLRNDVVIIDVLGFTAMDRVAAEDLFRFVTAAYEKRSLIVSTNVEFERWTRFLPDENRRHRDSRPAPSRPGRSRGPPAS